MNGERFDGFELVSPPLQTEEDAQKFATVIDQIQASGKFKRGYSSSTQFTFDVSHLVPVGPNGLVEYKTNIASFVDLILNLEMDLPEIYRTVAPRRYSQVINRYAVPLSLNQRDLLRELAELPRSERTYGNVQEIFKRYDGREMKLVEGRKVHAWKFRAFNYAKVFGLGTWQNSVVEVRISDLIEDGATFLRVGEFFARTLESAAARPVSEFRDPFHEIENFKVGSESHRKLDAELRKSPKAEAPMAEVLMLQSLECQLLFAL